MNRRSFLSFLSAAPVALPMAAKTMAAQPHVGGCLPADFVPLSATSEFATLVGESASSDFVPKVVQTLTIDVEQSPAFRAFMAKMERVTLRSVAEQFHDDLALLADNDEPILRDTPEPQAPVSPDNQKEVTA
jgi:hypothetical protein